MNAFNALAFQKLDDRLLTYLKAKVRALNSNRIKMTHQDLGDELGTAARETVFDFTYHRKKIIDSGSRLYLNAYYQSSYSISNKVLSIYDSKRDRDVILIKPDEDKMKKLIIQLEAMGLHKKKIKRVNRSFARFK